MKMALILIGIFAHLSAILNVCKLDYHPIERFGSVNKRALEDLLKTH